jgi:pyruvate/2-oxoglutarate dehydrogenase complex dihydrolipoamide dehydrogenase (E3) component
MQYDIAVIGNDEAAIEMMCLAAESGKRTAALLPDSTHSAWLVGLALRRLISDLLVDQSISRRQLLARTGSPRLLRQLVAGAIARETEELVCMLEHLNIHIRMGQSRFVDRHSVSIADGRTCNRSCLSAHHFVIGTGIRRTAMHRPLGLVALHRPESMFEGTILPRSICLLGGNSFGCGMAALFSLFGVQTRHVAHDSQNSAMLELAHAAGVEIAFHLSECGLTQAGGVLVNSHAEVVDCRRAVGFTEHLNLSSIDVEADENGQLWCSSGLETWCRGVYGIGDVVGFSADSTVHPSVQAERIHRRIGPQIPRPRIMDLFPNTEQHRVVLQ